MPPDVLILGAGAAGLTAAIDLARAGLRVEILEARDRIGGRMFTQLDPTFNHPVELGAEFVHGLPPEIWQLIQRNHLQTAEVEGDLWCSLDGNLQQCNFFAQADRILAAMDDKTPDESFLDFLARRFPDPNPSDSKLADAKKWATGYVSGFNAANPADVSVQWLVNNQRAEEQIEGHRAFRIRGGYQTLLDTVLTELTNLEDGDAGVLARANISLNTAVRQIHWHPGSVQVLADAPNSNATFTAPRVLITLPLGVLQSPQSIHFEPALPPEKKHALEKLAMGKVVRITLCFRHPFWNDIHPKGKRSLSDLSFLFSRHELFPTWWTQMPEHIPIITGWAPAASAEKLAVMTDAQIIDQALEALGSLLRVTKSHVESQLVSAYFHNWDTDPFSLGAYSYAKVGGEGSQQVLAAPLDNTLFFAGEHTDTTGHNGTVHAAIATGHRAATQILRAFGK